MQSENKMLCFISPHEYWTNASWKQLNRWESEPCRDLQLEIGKKVKELYAKALWSQALCLYPNQHIETPVTDVMQLVDQYLGGDYAVEERNLQKSDPSCHVKMKWAPTNSDSPDLELRSAFGTDPRHDILLEQFEHTEIAPNNTAPDVWFSGAFSFMVTEEAESHH